MERSALSEIFKSKKVNKTEMSFRGSKQVGKIGGRKSTKALCPFRKKEHTGRRAKKNPAPKWDQENNLLRPISCSPAGLMYNKHNL